MLAPLFKSLKLFGRKKRKDDDVDLYGAWCLFVSTTSPTTSGCVTCWAKVEGSKGLLIVGIPVEPVKIHCKGNREHTQGKLRKDIFSWDGVKFFIK